MVDIIVGSIPPVHGRPGNPQQQRQPRPKNQPLREKRKAAEECRQAVRDGVIVTLSSQTELRNGSDRGKKNEG